jgi:N-acetylglutamate synthase-like GNAT family acetyltransferase
MAHMPSGFPDRVAQQLLGRLCDTAIERGAERIFAMVRDDGDGAPVLRQLSFSPVTRELTFVLVPGAARGGVANQSKVPMVDGLRRQEWSDAFGVHQLYRATTPPVVQLAEARRPQSWEPPRARFGGLPRLSRGVPGRRWVVVRENRVVGWVHLTATRRGAHHLSLMVDPSDSGLASSLVAVAMDAAWRVRAAAVFVSVRDHQWPEREALETAGFRLYETNVLMMKQLALAVPSARRNLAPALERVVS